MDAPKCRLCGERHWGLCANQMRETAYDGPVASGNQALPKVPKSAQPAKSDAERVKRWRANNRERYNETMRAYRARKKETPK
jgi:hypothetical protein